MFKQPPPAYSRLPPPYPMANGFSYRPAIFITALITAGWTLVWGIGAFQDINVDKNEKETKFASLDTALGGLYMGACGISLFGVIAATMDKVGYMRVYRLAAMFSALAVVTAGFIRTIVHFAYKHQLINECTEVLQGHSLTFRFGIWGPPITDTTDPAGAQDLCTTGWNHDSFIEVIYLIVEIVFMLLYTGVAIAYYRQLAAPPPGASPFDPLGAPLGMPLDPLNPLGAPPLDPLKGGNDPLNPLGPMKGGNDPLGLPPLGFDALPPLPAPAPAR